MSRPASPSTLRLLWGAIGVGGVLVALVLATAGPSRPAVPQHADAAFYLVALLSAAATGAAFALLRRLEVRLPAARGETEARALVQTHGVLALAVAETPAVIAGVAVFLTGNTLALAFLVPFVAFVALTWPSDARVARWLAKR